MAWPHICRLCYVFARNGASKEEVLQYRNGLQNLVTKEKLDALEGGTYAFVRRSVDGGPPKKRSIGSSWASQLGSRHSKLRVLIDPLMDIPDI